MRIHHCNSCGYQTDRDVAAAQVIKERGLSTVGQTGIMLTEGKEEGLCAEFIEAPCKPRFGAGVYTPARLSL
ncbi:MAG: hypothetical protein SAL07_08525 [Oscillatoria sp. PMC 1051.18]|nr:hypothetical protein [Oscillatoria sp. PMC 1051.18]